MWRGGYLDRGRGLFGVELPRGGELLQTVSSDFGRHEQARLAGACVHRLQYAALLLDRLPGSDHVDGFIEPLRSFRDDLALFNELGDTAFDAFRRQDRKSVVEGKRVSVSVDIGGGRS